MRSEDESNLRHLQCRVVMVNGVIVVRSKRRDGVPYKGSNEGDVVMIQTRPKYAEGHDVNASSKVSGGNCILTQPGHIAYAGFNPSETWFEGLHVPR